MHMFIVSSSFLVGSTHKRDFSFLWKWIELWCLWCYRCKPVNWCCLKKNGTYEYKFFGTMCSYKKQNFMTSLLLLQIKKFSAWFTTLIVKDIKKTQRRTYLQLELRYTCMEKSKHYNNGSTRKRLVTNFVHRFRKFYHYSFRPLERHFHSARWRWLARVFVFTTWRPQSPLLFTHCYITIRYYRPLL